MSSLFNQIFERVVFLYNGLQYLYMIEKEVYKLAHL